MTNYDIKITARGPLAEGGTLPLAEMARLLGEFQQTLERIALQLHGVRNVTGRRPAEIAAAVRLEFTQIRQGSSQLLIRQAESALTNDTLDSTLAVLHAGADSIKNGGDGLPIEFDPLVLNGLLRFSGGVAPGQINSVEVELNGEPIMLVDAQFRDITRTLTRQRTSRDITLVGLLQMTDFAPSSLRCRIDSLNESVLCDFDGTIKDDLLEHVNNLVEARGIGHFSTAGDRLLSLDLLSVTPVALGDGGEFEDLVSAQGVTPWDDFTDSESFMDELSEDEFYAFLSAAMSARPDRGWNDAAE